MGAAAARWGWELQLGSRGDVVSGAVDEDTVGGLRGQGEGRGGAHAQGECGAARVCSQPAAPPWPATHASLTPPPPALPFQGGRGGPAARAPRGGGVPPRRSGVRRPHRTPGQARQPLPADHRQPAALLVPRQAAVPPAGRRSGAAAPGARAAQGGAAAGAGGRKGVDCAGGQGGRAARGWLVRPGAGCGRPAACNLER